MIVRNLDIVGITINESEADAPLVVDGNCVLSPSGSPELVESIPWRNPKIIQGDRQVDILELSPRPTYDLWRQPPGPPSGV